MNILFLDIDGVLNSESWYLSNEFKNKLSNKACYLETHLDNTAIDKLNQLCNKTDAKIVISSTWRTFSDCIPTLQKNGLTAEIIDVTPDLTELLPSGVWVSKTRGEEIQYWLDNNQWNNYVIIDDDSDMLESQKQNFVQTDDMYGITDLDVDQVIKIFEKQIIN